MRTFLITGGAGFIGSNFIPYFLKTHPDCALVNLDKLTYAGNLDHLKEVENHERYTFVQGDISNRQLTEYLFQQFDIRGILHFAAESHVDNSITGPEIFVDTNIKGTFNLIDCARRHWMSEPFSYKPGFEGCRFHHISTDEVYGSLGPDGFFDESTSYAPNSPYSASKASSDMIVRSFHHTYGLNTVITNCSNNFGPKQHDEKLIPTIIRKALAGEAVPIYGEGRNIRDWLYVLDHCEAIGAVFARGRAGETYVIGTHNEWTNLELAMCICKKLGACDQITFVKDRPGHDLRYAIDPTKIQTELRWKPKSNFETHLDETIEWYTEKYTTALA